MPITPNKPKANAVRVRADQLKRGQSIYLDNIKGAKPAFYPIRKLTCSCIGEIVVYTPSLTDRRRNIPSTFPANHEVYVIDEPKTPNAPRTAEPKFRPPTIHLDPTDPEGPASITIKPNCPLPGEARIVAKGPEGTMTISVQVDAEGFPVVDIAFGEGDNQEGHTFQIRKGDTLDGSERLIPKGDQLTITLAPRPFNVITTDSGEEIGNTTHAGRQDAVEAAVEKAIELNLYDTDAEEEERRNLTDLFNQQDAYEVDGYKIVITPAD